MVLGVGGQSGTSGDTRRDRIKLVTDHTGGSISAAQSKS